MDADMMQDILERLDRAYGRWLGVCYDDAATDKNVQRALLNLMEEINMVVHEYGLEE